MNLHLLPPLLGHTVQYMLSHSMHADWENSYGSRYDTRCASSPAGSLSLGASPIGLNVLGHAVLPL